MSDQGIDVLAAIGPRGGHHTAALVPFLTAGYPSLHATVGMLWSLEKAGADVIEVGVPFSDPMADGITIQRASERALSNGITLQVVLDQVRTFRDSGGSVPIVLMGYTNPFMAYGCDRLAIAAGAAGVDGIIIVDLADSDRAEWRQTLSENGITLVTLLAPTTSRQRIAQLAEEACGYIYLIALRGVTGAGHLNVQNVAEMVRCIRSISSLPVAVGFGIRTVAQALAVAKIADGVVVGSRLIEIIEENPDSPGDAIAGFIQAVKRAMMQ